MALETSLPWPANIPELKRLDELLRCGICYEFMSTAMVTICSHNFCSMCIRQYLGYKTQCPACFQETTGQQLRNNRLLDEIILLFPGLRDKTARQCQSAKGNTISGYLVKDSDSSDGSSTANTDVNLLSPDIRNKIKKDVATPSQAMSNDLLQTPRSSKSSYPVETPKRNHISTLSNSPFVPSKLSVGSPSSVSATQSPSTSSSISQSSRQSVSGFFSILGERSGGDSAVEEPRVNCPVCNVGVPERNINLHLDACLKRMEEGDKEEIICIKQTPKRKPLPKLVYSLLSEKQLRQMLKEVGLSNQGDKHQLTNRHRKYTTLFNVECDAAEPRAISELVRQVEREEREETKVTSTKSLFNYDRKTPAEVIEKEQVNYLKKNDNHFAKLIADVKKRQEEAKKKKLKKPVGGEHSEDKLSVPKTSIVNSRSASKSKINSNHHLSSSDTNVARMLSSSDDDSDIDNDCFKGKNLRDIDSDYSKVKNLSTVNNKTNSLLNYFQNSPKKISQSAHRNSSTSNHDHEDLLATDDDDFFSEKYINIDDSELVPSDSSNTPVLNDMTNTSDQKPNGYATVAKCKVEDTIKPSPDFFSPSPVHSDSSEESVSLLKDQELDEEEMDVPVVPSETLIEAEVENDSEDELIPGHQPESCPLDSQPDKPPSPSIGKRVTRRNQSSSQPPQPDLSDLGPETQDLELDSQGDPEYQPSQMMDDMDLEDIVPITRKSKRNSRKRQGNEEPMEVPRSRRRKK